MPPIAYSSHPIGCFSIKVIVRFSSSLKAFFRETLRVSSWRVFGRRIQFLLEKTWNSTLKREGQASVQVRYCFLSDQSSEAFLKAWLLPILYLKCLSLKEPQKSCPIGFWNKSCLWPLSRNVEPVSVLKVFSHLLLHTYSFWLDISCANHGSHWVMLPNKWWKPCREICLKRLQVCGAMSLESVHEIVQDLVHIRNISEEDHYFL